jgi:glycine dehydrogenase
MLNTVGARSLEDLMDKVIPANIRAKQPLNLPTALSERNALSDLRRIAGRNRLFTSLIGMGYYGCVTPKVIQRNILENPGWYTAVHALPGRDQPGPAGSAAELPADGCRPDRA